METICSHTRRQRNVKKTEGKEWWRSERAEPQPAVATVGGVSDSWSHTEMNTQHFLLVAVDWNQMLTLLLLAVSLTACLSHCLPVSLTHFLYDWLQGCRRSCSCSGRDDSVSVFRVGSGLCNHSGVSLSDSVTVCLHTCLYTWGQLHKDRLFSCVSTQKYPEPFISGTNVQEIKRFLWCFNHVRLKTVTMRRICRICFWLTVMNYCLCFLSNSVLMAQNKLDCGCRLLKMEVVMREWISVPGS